MPQSWPSQWMFLFFLFLSILILMMIFNYYIMQFSSIKKEYSNLKSISFNWLW